MIAAASGPLDPAPERLHALYVSLNSPVVSLPALPVGPAQAAIAVHGAAGTTLLIRSARTGTVAFFHAPTRFGPLAALSHAEQLGFLFDEEAGEGGLGIEPDEWPRWLHEVFSSGSEEDGPLPDPSTCLSKFRWALLGGRGLGLVGSSAGD